MEFLEQFKDLPVHPMFVHFPVALFITSLIFEVLGLFIFKDSFHRTAICLFVFAAFFSILTVQTGEWEEHRLHLKHYLLDRHEFFAELTRNISLISLPILWLVYHKRPRWFRPLFILLLIFIVGTVSAAAFFGGKMVYEYGVGVAK